MNVGFGTLVDEWFNRIKISGRCTKSTLKGYRTIGKTLKKFIGETTRIKDIDPREVDKIFNEVMLKHIKRNGEIGYSNKSRKDFFHVFREIIDYANVQGYLYSNEQLSRLKSIKLIYPKDKSHVKTVPYSFSFFDDAFSKAETIEQKCIIYMYAISSLIGTRVGELLALKESDYSNGELDINVSLVYGEIKDVKNDYSKRRLVLTECAKKILDDYIEYSKVLRNKLTNNENEQWLFFDPKKCIPWNDAGQAYKFSGRIFHELGFSDEFRGLKPTRHTCVTVSKESNTPDENLGAYFGHKSIFTTYNYYVGRNVLLRNAPEFHVELPSMGWKGKQPDTGSLSVSN